MTWWKWLLAGAVGGVLIGWFIRTPSVRVEERIVTKTVVQWKYRERIESGPGSVITLTRSADGTESTRIEGPVVIGRDGEGSASAMVDSSRKESKCPEPPDYVIAGGAQVGIDGIISYGGLVGRRMLGPFWLYAGAYAPPLRAVAMVGVSF